MRNNLLEWTVPRTFHPARYCLRTHSKNRTLSWSSVVFDGHYSEDILACQLPQLIKYLLVVCHWYRTYPYLQAEFVLISWIEGEWGAAPAGGAAGMVPLLGRPCLERLLVSFTHLHHSLLGQSQRVKAKFDNMPWTWEKEGSMWSGVIDHDRV